MKHLSFSLAALLPSLWRSLPNSANCRGEERRRGSEQHCSNIGERSEKYRPMMCTYNSLCRATYLPGERRRSIGMVYEEGSVIRMVSQGFDSPLHRECPGILGARTPEEERRPAGA